MVSCIHAALSTMIIAIDLNDSFNLAEFSGHKKKYYDFEPSHKKRLLGSHIEQPFYRVDETDKFSEWQTLYFTFYLECIKRTMILNRR